MLKVIMVSGKQGSGKSTLCDKLQQALGDKCYRTRFAKTLYEMHDAAMKVAKGRGIPVADKEGVFLQLVGTEWGRNTKGENVWVDACRSECFANAQDKIVLIDDMRFPNEFHAFDDVQVVKVRLTADEETRKARTHSWRDNTNHPSETGLDDYERKWKFSIQINTDVRNADEVLTAVLKCLPFPGVTDDNSLRSTGNQPAGDVPNKAGNS